MRKDFGSQPWLVPQLVALVAAYDENEVPNVMNAAWGGTYANNQIMLCISAGHRTTKNIMARKAFTVSIADEANLVAADYVGIVSGNKVPDKFAKAGFHAVKSQFVDAPLIEEIPLALECRLAGLTESGCVIGEVVNVSADESILAEDGKPDIAKMRAISFDPVHHDYLLIGESVGQAFRDGRRLGSENI
ncbi:MAG: flavin reductase family protein [Clostridia bacterium]|nr:flavin reductase family protein [Clostridia bacterium]